MIDDSMHALPAQVLGLTAAAQRAMPQPGDLEAEDLHPCPVAGHGEVACVPADHRAQVLSLLGNRAVHAPSQLVLDRVQIGTQPLGTGQPQDHEFALLGLATAMREAQEVEGLGFALSLAASVVPGEAPELDQPRLALKVKTDADVKVQTARITADATMRAAEISAASDKQIEAVLKRMDDLVRQVQVTNKAAIEATRTAEQAEKRAEAAAAAAAAATPAPEPAKAAPEPAAPPPAQPITLNVQIDAKPGPVTRQVVVERDKDGNMVSATAVDKVPANEKEGK